MFAGRGLGHTGGTIDKLESISGFRCSLDVLEFTELLRSCGMAMSEATTMIAPADRKLYVLRDATATINNLGLITASIMSKKIAGGANGIVFDIKIGRGAFMKTEEDGIELASSLLKVAKAHQMDAIAVLTRMDDPLGNTIGNALEIRETVDALNGRGPSDVMEISYKLVDEMLRLSGVEEEELRREKMSRAIRSGKAMEIFKKWIGSCDGDISFIDNPDILPSSQFQTEILADKDGFVQQVNSHELGLLSVELGAWTK